MGETLFKRVKGNNCKTLNIRNKPSLLGKKIGTLKKELK